MEVGDVLLVEWWSEEASGVQVGLDGRVLAPPPELDTAILQLIYFHSFIKFDSELARELDKSSLYYMQCHELLIKSSSDKLAEWLWRVTQA